MPRMRSWVLGVLAAGLVAGFPASACADSQPLRSTGGVVVNWRASSERGCDALGLCGMSGQLVAALSGDGDIDPGDAPDDDNPDAGEFELFDRGSIVSRVRREGGGTCVESFSAGGDEHLGVVTAEGQNNLKLALDLHVSPARCGGPTAVDLRRGTPTFTIPRRALAGAAVQLGGSFPFDSGPFTGDVSSNWAFRIKRPSRRSRAS